MKRSAYLEGKRTPDPGDRVENIEKNGAQNMKKLISSIILSLVLVLSGGCAGMQMRDSIPVMTAENEYSTVYISTNTKGQTAYMHMEKDAPLVKYMESMQGAGHILYFWVDYASEALVVAMDTDNDGKVDRVLAYKIYVQDAGDMNALLTEDYVNVRPYNIVDIGVDKFFEYLNKEIANSSA